MKKFQTYISVAVLSITMFSCANKNQWTPELEAEFKKETKKEILNNPDNPFTEEQATLMTNCMTDKLKKQNILPDDVEKHENEAKLLSIATECSKEVLLGK